MPQVPLEESFEQLTRPNNVPRYDGTISEIFTDTVTVRLIGVRRVVTGVKVPDFISVDDLRIGHRVRLGQSAAGSYIAAHFEPCGDTGGAGPVAECDTPPTPRAEVSALTESWLITWTIDIDAEVDYYVLYVNDEPSTSGMIEVGSYGGSATVPFNHLPDDDYRYFAVRAVQGACRSGLRWATGRRNQVSLAIAQVTPFSLPAILAFNEAGCQALTGGTWELRNDAVPTVHHAANEGGWPGSIWPQAATTLWGAKGTLYTSDDFGLTWTEITGLTDPPNPAGDSPAPTLANVSLIQAASNGTEVVLLASWVNGEGTGRGWLLITDDGFTTHTWSFIA